MKTHIEHCSEQHRFQLLVGTEIASFCEYSDTDGMRNFFHTVTLPQYRGNGLAALLTEYALNDARDHGMTVLPSCWFVREFIEVNSDSYGDLVSPDGRPLPQ